MSSGAGVRVMMWCRTSGLETFREGGGKLGEVWSGEASLVGLEMG